MSHFDVPPIFLEKIMPFLENTTCFARIPVPVSTHYASVSGLPKLRI